jgi:hypothetical protein
VKVQFCQDAGGIGALIGSQFTYTSVMSGDGYPYPTIPAVQISVDIYNSFYTALQEGEVVNVSFPFCTWFLGISNIIDACSGVEVLSEPYGTFEAQRHGTIINADALCDWEFPFFTEFVIQLLTC